MSNIEFNTAPASIKKGFGKDINSFLSSEVSNLDLKTVESFGEEWTKFNNFDEIELEMIASDYFDLIDLEELKEKSVLDVGCGSGRWSYFLKDKVGSIDAIDPSDAVFTAANMLQSSPNIRISRASVSSLPFHDNSFDFVISLGVLHHIPDTEEGIRCCVSKLKPGGKFLIYLYYDLDNRGPMYKFLFFSTKIVRAVVSRMPSKLKKIMCDLLAITIYLPLVIISRVMDRIAGLNRFIEYIPLSYYRKTSFHIIRNDALDRFGTPLEKRFSREQIKNMLESSGLTNIIFSEKEPYWHAVGTKRI